MKGKSSRIRCHLFERSDSGVTKQRRSMPPLSEEELEERLTAAGSSLLQPPTALDDLLSLLDQIEQLLSKVEQSPAKSMQDAISPLMKRLVADELVQHSDVAVKVGVASCISEITRITAPDAPYDDDKMKDVFQLIVSSFENLSDVSSRSHEKRATILETVAKVRSCVIMLDLECEQMIIEMFQHFLKAIRDYHAEGIFTSMETIMTLVLEESEDVSPDLLNPILATLKRNNEAAMPISKKLAERVIQNSADKIRPYLTQAVKSLDAAFSDFGEVVASVCQENTGTVRHSNESILRDQPGFERKSTSASPVRDPVIQETTQDKDPTMTKSPKSIVTNGADETGTEQIMTDGNSSEKTNSHHQLDAKSMSKVESDDSGAQTPVKLEAKVEHAEAQHVPYNHEIPRKDVHISTIEVKPVEPAKSLDKVKGTTAQLLPSESPENVAVNETSPTQSGSVLHESRAEKDNLANMKENFVEEEIESVDTASKKTSEGEVISQVKKQLSSGNKRAEETTDKEKSLTEDGASKADDGGTSDSEARSPDRTDQLGEASNKMEEGSSLRKEEDKKRGRVRPTTEKDVKSSAREDRGKDTVTSPRSPLKSMKDEGIQEETPRTSTKRKQTPGTEKVSDTVKYGKNLVGSKVKVWWPDDETFYEGVIASFDYVKKKHKVLYTDGDKEVLNLRKEKWEFVGNDLVSDGDQDVEHSSHDTSSDVQGKKKRNTNSETSSKRQKIEGSTKSKPKNASTKSGGKSKDDGKGESESKDDNSKSSRKSVDETIKPKDRSQKGKTTGRSNTDVAKTSSRSKQDSPRTPKSKGKTPQSGRVSDAKMPKSSSSKVKETDRMKGKTADLAKSGEIAKGRSSDNVKPREGETKSGKKRRK